MYSCHQSHWEMSSKSYQDNELAWSSISTFVLWGRSHSFNVMMLCSVACCRIDWAWRVTWTQKRKWGNSHVDVQFSDGKSGSFGSVHLSQPALLTPKWLLWLFFVAYIILLPKCAKINVQDIKHIKCIIYTLTMEHYTVKINVKYQN